MSLFLIICKSCAARLNVSKVSAIGQLLACPKCGTMIEVNPPKDWQPPATEESNSESATERIPAGDPVTTSFDDIDQILGSSTPSKSKPKRPQNPRSGQNPQSGQRAGKPNSAGKNPLAGSVPKPISKASRSRPPSGTLKPSTKRPAPASPTKAKRSAGPNGKSTQTQTSEPILPTDDWTSEASKQRKRAITIVAASVGGIVLCLGIVAAIVNFSKKPDVSVANNSDTDNSIADSDSPAAENDNPNVASIDQTVDQAADDNSPDLNTTLDTDSNGEIASTTPPALPAFGNAPEIAIDEGTSPPAISDVPPPSITTNLNTAMSDPQSSNSPLNEEQKNAQDNVSQKKAPVMNPLDGVNRALSSGLANENAAAPKKNLRDLNSLNSTMEDLSDFLSAKGTSIFEMKDLAEANRERRQIGIPKYFVEKPEAKKVDVERQLSMTCNGLRYSDTNLIRILRDITAITGVPVTLDVQSIVANGGSINPKLDVDVQEADFGDVIDSILQPLGMMKTLGAHNSLVIRSTRNDDFEPKTHVLPDFPVNVAAGDDKEPDAREVFVGSIQGLIAPTSWVREADPATIELADQEIIVRNSPTAHYLIDEFVGKIQAAITLTTDLENPAAREKLDTRWNSIAERMANPVGIPKSTARTLVGLLNEIQTHTGVTVIVDWENLLPLGWNPQTRVPGNLSEKNLESTLRQLSRSMNLTIRPIDQNTIELTTFEKSAATVNLEVYHVGRILNGQLSEPLAKSLIEQALSNQLRAPNVRYLYESKCKCWVLLAPQSLQKQMGSVIKKLESLR